MPSAGTLEAQKATLAVLLQLTCKLPYLFFPRDIHDTFGIVVKAFAQKVGQFGLEFCPLCERMRNKQFLRFGTCQRALRKCSCWIRLRIS